MSSILDAMKRKKEDEGIGRLRYRQARKKKSNLPLKALIISLATLVGLAIISFTVVFAMNIWDNRQAEGLQKNNSEILLQQLRQIVQEEISNKPKQPAIQPTPIIVVMQPTVQPSATPADTSVPAELATPKPLPTQTVKRVEPTPMPASEFDLKVQGIIWNDKKPMAIINGNLREAGDTIDGYTIQSIDKNGIYLDGISGIISPGR